MGERTTDKVDDSVIEREPSNRRPLIGHGIKQNACDTWIAGHVQAREEQNPTSRGICSFCQSQNSTSLPVFDSLVFGTISKKYLMQKTSLFLCSTNSARIFSWITLRSTLHHPMSTKARRPHVAIADEEALLLPSPPSNSKIVDTHTHLALTYGMYRKHYKDGKHQNVHHFFREMYAGREVEAVVDVWCEAPVRKEWKEYADSALTVQDRTQLWGGTEYWFVMGTRHYHILLGC